MFENIYSFCGVVWRGARMHALYYYYSHNHLDRVRKYLYRTRVVLSKQLLFKKLENNMFRYRCLSFRIEKIGYSELRIIASLSIKSRVNNRRYYIYPIGVYSG